MAGVEMESGEPSEGLPGRARLPLVLVVDDRRDVAATIAALCRAAGARAIAASDGEPVRVLLGRHRPGGVILDIMMPDEDGYEALKEVAAFDPAIAVLLVSGHGDEWLRMGLRLGRAQGLRSLRAEPKPLRADVIRSFVAALPVAQPDG